MKTTLVSFALLGGMASGWAQVSYGGGSYAQDFDSLSSGAWADNATLAGWYSNRTTYSFSTGSATAGGLYAYGASSGAERALGALSSGSANPVLFAVRIRNDTGGALASFSVSFWGEQWRSGDTAVESLGFDFKVGAGSILDTGFTAVGELAFDSPDVSGVGAVDGNASSNRAFLSHTVQGLDWPDGADLWLRWSKPDTLGTDHGLGIDDLSFSARAPVPEPVTIALSAAVLGVVARRRRRRAAL